MGSYLDPDIWVIFWLKGTMLLVFLFNAHSQHLCFQPPRGHQKCFFFEQKHVSFQKKIHTRNISPSLSQEEVGCAWAGGCPPLPPWASLLLTPVHAALATADGTFQPQALEAAPSFRSGSNPAHHLLLYDPNSLHIFKGLAKKIKKE